MTTTLSEGVKVPDVGSVNWAGDLEVNWNLLNGALANLSGNVKLDRDNTWTGEQSFTLPIVGSITGTASKAIADEDGTSIKTGYVNVAGNQTVTGQKTWSASQFYNGMMILQASSDVVEQFRQKLPKDVSTSTDALARFNTLVDSAGHNVVITTEGHWETYVSKSVTLKYKNDSTKAGTVDFRLDSNGKGILYPQSPFECSLGNATNQWSSVYAQSYYYNGTEFQSKFVTTDTIQTINASKTINSAFPYLYIKNPNKEKGVAPSDRQWGRLNFTDKNNVTIAGMEHSIYSNGVSQLAISINNLYSNGTLNPSGTLESCAITLELSSSGGKSIVPGANASTDLGTSTNQWKSVYAQSYYYNGTAWGLDKANVWSKSNTYSGNVSLYNSDNTQDTPTLYLRNSKATILSSGNTAGFQGIYFNDSNNSTLAYIRGAVQSNGCVINLKTFAKDSNNNTVENGIQIGSFTDGSKWVAPTENGTIALGGTNYKWKTLNGVNPGALSLPDYNSTAKVNISGSIVPDQYGNIVYTPPINGWLYVCFNVSNATTSDSIFYIQAKDNNVANSSFVQTSWMPASSGTSSLAIFFPVVANKQFVMQINFSNYTIVKAHVIPCLGNV